MISHPSLDAHTLRAKMRTVSYARHYKSYARVDEMRRVTGNGANFRHVIENASAIDAFRMKKNAGGQEGHVARTGMLAMADCRMALNALDEIGWRRSFHQKRFHDAFIAACTRIFYKTCPPGTFEREYQTILDVNSWDSLSQEILISTPRRFGKVACPLAMKRNACLAGCVHLRSKPQ